ERASGVLRQIEAGHVRREQLRRSGTVRWSTEQRAASRTSRAPRLPEQSAAVGRELITVHAVVHLARRNGSIERRRPQLDLEVALLRRLYEVQDAPALQGEALDALRELARGAPGWRHHQGSRAGAAVVPRQEGEVAAVREAKLAHAFAKRLGWASGARQARERAERLPWLAVRREQRHVPFRDGERGRPADVARPAVERLQHAQQPIAALGTGRTEHEERSVRAEDEIGAGLRHLATAAGAHVHQVHTPGRGARAAARQAIAAGRPGKGL